MKNPLIDEKFYDDKPFLTAKKLIDGAGMYEDTIKYIKEHKTTTVVMTFFADLEKWLKTIGDYEIIGVLPGGEDEHPIYASNGLLFVVPFVGSPNAAGSMEELAALGVKNFIACGSAGLIDHTFDGKKMLVVESAVRDEGTSYHYAEADVLAETDKFLTKCIEQAMKTHNMNYEVGRAWTTDAIYRETEKLIKLRLKQKCVAVEMECATWCVVAKKLGLRFAQFLFFSDAVNGVDDWSFFPEKYRKNLKMIMTEIAYESAKIFEKEK